MPRRFTLLLVALLAGVSFVVPTLSSADPPATTPTLPTFGCPAALSDPAGDAYPDYVNVGSTGAPVAQQLGNHPALDIRMVALRLTATQFQVFMALTGVPDPAAMAPNEETYRYTVTFTFKGKPFVYGDEIYNPAYASPAYPLDSPSYPKQTANGASVGGPNPTIVKGTGTAPSWVVFTSPRALVEKLTGPIDPTDKVTALAGLTQIYVFQGKAQVDTTSTTAPQQTWAVNDDSCFGPPLTSLGRLTVAPAVYSRPVALSAVLLDDANKPLAGEPVTFTIGSSSVTATTDAAGKAAVSSGPVTLRAGTYPVVARYAGDADHKTSSVTGTVTVSPDAPSFTALAVAKKGAKRTVTTKLLAGKSALAGLAVDWYVNGKKAATTKTDKTGTAVFGSGKPGQKVQARYAGAPGMYLAAVSKTVTL